MGISLVFVLACAVLLAGKNTAVANPLLLDPSRIAELERRLEEQERALEKQRHEVETLKRQVEEARSLVQKEKETLEEKARERQTPRELTFESVRAGFGKITVGGLAQGWFVGSSRDVNTSLRLRRMELKLTGEITPRVSWTVMIDPTKSLSLSQGPPVAVNQSSKILQDFFLTYKLTPALSLDVGQYKVPLSMEGLRSSAQLYTVERAIFNVLPVREGRVGDIRDVGLQLRGSYLLPWWRQEARSEFAVGVFNDGGPGQNAVDTNDQKAVIGRAALFPVNNLRLGVYGGRGGTKAIARDRLGGEFSYRYGRNLLEAEYVTSKDGHPATDSWGWYTLYGFDLTPALQAVARYEQWDPNDRRSQDTEWDLTLGLNWYVQKHNAKVQLNWVHKDIGRCAPSFLGRSRELVLINWQAAF